MRVTMRVEKGIRRLTNSMYYTEGVDEVTMRKVPWHLPLHRTSPIKGAIFTTSYICLSH